MKFKRCMKHFKKVQHLAKIEQNIIYTLGLVATLHALG